MKIIGLDVGEKRIGVAKVDSSTRIAVPVGFVLADGSEWEEIARIARVNGANYFVLGLPRSNEGNETKQSLYVRNFAKTLASKVPGAKIRFQDESLTSVEAEERLKRSKKQYQKGDIDTEAATIILQDFIEGFKEETGVKATDIPTNLVKKEADKVKMQTKKISNGVRNALIISPLMLLLLVGGAVGAIVWRQNVLREREEMWAALEAEMRPDVFDFTIRPGETIFDIEENLVKAGYTEAEVEEALAYDYSDEEGMEFLKSRPGVARLEGYLYGETHEFYRESTAKDIVRTFLLGMGEVIRENDLEAKYLAKGLTLYEGITLASIVQKEAAPAEQATVAQVFLSRLANGMALGSDVTVTYALDVEDPDREVYRDNAAALAVNSCYNTRLYGGLPCGPISNPALSALTAVAEPSDSAYLFFLTGDDGLMYYSYTAEEHAENARRYCQELCLVSL